MTGPNKSELNIILLALESAEAEFEQLMRDEEWFVTDVVDLQASALEIVRGHLGIEQEKDYTDEQLLEID